MGGTSTDVCLVPGGNAERASERSVGGLPIRLPTVDLHTVGAGGGSIVWRDSGGAPPGRTAERRRRPGAGLLRPRRHGADGNRCELAARPAPGRASWRARLDRDAAERALAGLDPAHVIDIVNAEMFAPCGSFPSSEATTRASSRSSPSAAPGRSTRALAEEPRDRDRARPRRRWRALRARARGQRRALRPCAVVRRSARRGGRASLLPVRRSSATAASRSSWRCHSGQASRSASTARTRNATGTPITVGRSTRLRANRRRPSWPSDQAPARRSAARRVRRWSARGATCWIPVRVGARDGDTTLILTRS